MTDIKLPPMPKPHTPPVFATAANTPSVKAGYELGGYEKTPPLFDEHQLEAFAREAVRLNAQAVPEPAYVELPDDIRVPLDSVFADAGYLIGRLLLGTMSAAQVIRVIQDRIEVAKAATRTALSAAPAAPQPAQPLDLGVMELAESVGLIGPASRTDDLHEAIQRFHDLIVVNASIKAARHFADGLAKQPLTDEQIDAVTMAARDDLLDDIYENGTASEGVMRRIRKIARAVEQAHEIGVKS